MSHYLGIEIGGTKLQLGVGADDGVLAGLWRGAVAPEAGPDGIRRQITRAIPELLERASVDRSLLKGVGVGFGGPVDDATRTVIKSHQIEGWDNFPLADWVSETVGLPAALGNDADAAGLAEALHGAGKGLSPIFYITIGSGIGGGFVVNGEIYRGVGKGAAEIGHLTVDYSPAAPAILEERASGWAIDRRACEVYKSERNAAAVAAAARNGDAAALAILSEAWDHLANAIRSVVVLLCPRRIVIGGGVSLMGEGLFFEPLRRKTADRMFKPFADCYDIVPAALGEEVVVHGAIALASRKLGRREVRG